MIKLLLILHFLGLAIGCGAPCFMAVLRPAFLKMDGVDAKPFLMKAGRTGNMLSKAGVSLLIVTGLALVWSGDFAGQTASPLFVVKMAAVALVTVYVGAMHVFMRRAAGGNAAAAQRVALYAPWGLVIAPLPVIFAVLTFS